MDIYVIRHPPVAVAKGICYGQSDLPLADSFETDAARLKDQLPERFDTVYTSPLSRCMKLATYVSEQPIVSDLLLEMNFGDWENRNWDDLDQPALFEWMADPVTVCPPGGENLQHLSQRISQFLDGLPQAEGKILIVTHAGPIRCMWGHLLELPLRNLMKLPVGFGEVFAFHWAEDPAYRRILQKR